jgi:hypothetical protein
VYHFYEVIVPNKLRATVQRTRVRLRLPPINASAASMGKRCRRLNVLINLLQASAVTLRQPGQIQRLDWNGSSSLLKKSFCRAAGM